MRRNLIHPAALCALSSVLTFVSAARADGTDKCADWFCAGDEAQPPDVPKQGLAAGTPVEIDLKNGGAVHGVVVSVNAERLVLRAGAVEITIAWLEIAGLRIVVQSAPPAAPAPTPVEAPKPEPETEPADEPVVAPAPANTPKPQAAPTMVFPPQHDILFLDVRVKVLAPLEGSTFHTGSAAMSQFLPIGGAWELGLALGLSPHWLLRGFYENAAFAPGEHSSRRDDVATSRLVGLSVMGTAGTIDDDGVAGSLEVGFGYRWLTVPYDSRFTPDRIDRNARAGEITFEGLASLRIATGLTFALSRVARLHVLGELTFGQFSQRSDRLLSCSDRLSCDTIATGAQTAHGFAGLTMGLELGAR